MNYPAITMCNRRGHNSGEYVRAVFNNFDFLVKEADVKKTEVQELRKSFKDFLEGTSDELLRNFQGGWGRCEWKLNYE